MQEVEVSPNLHQRMLKNIQSQNYVQNKLFRVLALQQKNENLKVDKEKLNDLCDNLIPPNSIIEAKVTKLEYSGNKLTHIETKLTKYKAMSHSGKHLYAPYKRHAHLYEDGGKSQKSALCFNAFRNQAESLEKNGKFIF